MIYNSPTIYSSSGDDDDVAVIDEPATYAEPTYAEDDDRSVDEPAAAYARPAYTENGDRVLGNVPTIYVRSYAPVGRTIVVRGVITGDDD